MTKYELIYTFAKNAYDLSLSRRKEIRDRINVIAGFGLSIIVVLATVFFNKFSEKQVKMDCFKIILFSATLVSSVLFIFYYMKSYGIKTILGVDPEALSIQLSTIVNDDLRMQQLYLNQLEFYEKNNINDSILLAENDAIYSYKTKLLDEQTNIIYDNTSYIHKSATHMNICMLITIVLLIIMRGVI